MGLTRKNFRRYLSLACFSLASLCVFVVVAASPFKTLPSDLTAKSVSIPLYEQATGKILGVVRIEKLAQEHQRKGFFRIGVLPIVVAEGVTLEISDSAVESDVLAKIQSRLLAAKEEMPIEFRKMKIFFGAARSISLQAEKARLGIAGRWELQDKIVLQIASREIKATAAFLEAKGPRAGQVTLFAPDGEQTLNLLQLIKPPVDSSKTTNEN